jgi:hypothetical protein
MTGPGGIASRCGEFLLGFSLPALVFLAVFAPVTFHLNHDGDLFWHLATGRWIVAHGQVPTLDIFSFTFSGKPWVAHEWLSAVAFYGVYAAMGWGGVAALTAVAVACALAQITTFLQRRLQPYLVVALAALSLGLVFPHLLARPHVLAMPLGVYWTTHLLEAKETDRAPSWSLLAVLILWANLHGGYVLAMPFLLVLAGEAIFQASPEERSKRCRRWGGFLAAAGLASLLTPNGIEGVLHPFRMMGMGYALDSINEWRSPIFRGIHPLEAWLFLVLGVGFSLGVRLPPFRLLVLLGLLHLALRHERNVDVLGLYAPLFLASPLKPFLARRPGQKPYPLDRFLGRLAPRLDRTHRLAMALLLGMLVVVAARTGIAPLSVVAPQKAVAAAHRQGLADRRVLNDYAWGGYLIFEGIPPFIDGRADLFGDSFLREYARAVAVLGPESLPALLERYRIEWTLLGKESPAVALLDRLPNWERRFQDDLAVIHVRRSPHSP